MPTPSPLDDVEFLARSRYRVQVLQTLTAGPRTRRGLHDETGISQPTLGRVLGALQDRNWVERRRQEYGLTPWGELLAEEFGTLLDTVETIQQMGDLVTLLPTARMDFDLRRFGSARITTPQTGDVFRHVRRAEEVLREATHVRILTDTISPGTLETQLERVVHARDGDLTIESVITEAALEQAYADQRLVGWIRDLLETGRAPVHRYEGTIPMTLVLADDTAMMAPTDDRGIPGALIESEDEVVRTWVEDQFDTYRSQSRELTVDDLPP